MVLEVKEYVGNKPTVVAGGQGNVQETQHGADEDMDNRRSNLQDKATVSVSS